jgi:hypothetical protein
MSMIRAAVACGVWLSIAACSSKSTFEPDAGPSSAAPDPSWLHSYEGTLFARALDVSCAPADAGPGVEGCIGLVRYLGKLNDAGIQDTSSSYGRVAFVRTDGAGGISWTQSLMSGFAPISAETGSFVDEDTRVHLLANDEFLVSGTYEGRVFFGTPGGNNQELGPSTNRNLFMVEFHQDGTFDNWEDTGNGAELHALGCVEMPSTQIIIAGSCQGDVPLDSGSFSCGSATSGYLLRINYDGSTIGAVTFGGKRAARASDVAADPEGNLYVSGTFNEQMQFGSEPPDLAAGEDDGFLMKLNPDGSRAWIVFAGGLGSDQGGRIGRTASGSLWTSVVSSGVRIGEQTFPEGGQVVAAVDDRGAVAWARLVPDARQDAPLGVAVAEDGSFALYGNGFLARFAADGAPLWERTDADVSGASFTKTALVVAATVTGNKLFGATIATTADDNLRAGLAAFPR